VDVIAELCAMFVLKIQQQLLIAIAGIAKKLQGQHS
jgi:hypothetical protein